MIERPRTGTSDYRTLNQAVFKIDRHLRDSESPVVIGFEHDDWQLISRAIAGFLHPENVVDTSVSQSCPECERLAEAIEKIHAASLKRGNEEDLAVAISEAIEVANV